MKSKFILATIAALAFMSTQVTAQFADESRVKILPTAEEGIIKVHYAIETDETIDIKFFTDNGTILTDKIKGGPFPKGVSKRYDVTRIKEKDYWIDISSSRMTITYHLVPSKNNSGFTPYLEKTTYNHPVVAKNN